MTIFEQYRVHCWECSGSGRCGLCRGTGILSAALQTVYNTKACVKCSNGSGVCITCGGHGTFHPTRTPVARRHAPDAGFELCAECRGDRYCRDCMGTAIAIEGKTCDGCEHGVCSSCFGAGQTRVEARGPDPAKQLTIRFGSEFAPDAPWGLELLSIASDGTVRYENRDHGRCRTVFGVVPQAKSQHLMDLLAASSFPAVPKHRFPPGASIVQLDLRFGDASQTAEFDQYFAEGLPGLGELVAECDALAAAIRKSDAAALCQWEFREVPGNSGTEARVESPR